MRGSIPSKSWDAPFTRSLDRIHLVRTSARHLNCQIEGSWRARCLRYDSLKLTITLTKIWSYVTDKCCFVSFKSQIHSLNQPTIKHNVKSLITSPSKLPHSMPQLEAMERVKYEDNKPVRHTSVVNSTTSVLRSTHQEANRSQHSPGMYEDTNSRRTPVNYSTNPVSRGSPMLGRTSEGNFHILELKNSHYLCVLFTSLWTCNS